MERRVRDTKRKVQGLKAAMDKAEDPADREELRGRYQQAARKLQQQNRDYNEFCGANELKPYRERLHIAGWDRKQAASATGAARAAEKAAKPTVESAPLTEPAKTGIIDEKGQQEEKLDVHTVGRIDIEKYKCVTEGIQTDEVIITDERIAHIQEEHPNDFERYSKHIAEMVEDPQYILQDPDPYTAVILQEFSEEGERFRLIMKLAVKTDGWKKNSIITFLKISEKKFKKYLRNKNVLYRKE